MRKFQNRAWISTRVIYDHANPSPILLGLCHIVWTQEGQSRPCGWPVPKSLMSTFLLQKASTKGLGKFSKAVLALRSECLQLHQHQNSAEGWSQAQVSGYVSRIPALVCEDWNPLEFPQLAGDIGAPGRMPLEETVPVYIPFLVQILTHFPREQE